MMTYTTWNDELEEADPDSIHTSSLEFENRDGTKQSLSLYCQDVYIDKCLDCVILFSDHLEQEVDLNTIRCLLKKGSVISSFQRQRIYIREPPSFSRGICRKNYL